MTAEIFWCESARCAAIGAAGAPRARSSIVSVKPQDSLPPSRNSVSSSVSSDTDEVQSDGERAATHAQPQPLKRQDSRAASVLQRGSRLGLDANGGGGGAMESANRMSMPADRPSVVHDSNVVVPSVMGAAMAAAGGGSRRAELIELLAHPVCVEVFKAHLARLHSEKSLAFYLAVQKYRALPTKQLRQAIAPRLVELFVRDGSPFEINVSQSLRKKLEKEAGSNGGGGATELYNAAQQECLLLMDERVGVVRTTASSAFAVCKAAMRELPMPSSNERVGGGEERLSLVFQGAEDHRDSLTADVTVTRSKV